MRLPDRVPNNPKTKPARLTIVPLSDHPGYRPLVVDWVLAEWGRGVSRCEVERDFGDSLSGEWPFSLLALWEGRPAGVARLVRRDRPAQPEERYWLAELLVVRSLRGRGVGRALLESAINEARRRRVDELYLYCRPARWGFYRGLGWCEVERRLTGEGEVVLGRYRLGE